MPVTKIVRADQLRPGMFINGFDLSWFEHPFVSSRLGLVNDPKIIAQLRALGVSEVEIDLGRGLDVEDGALPPPGEPERGDDPAPPFHVPPASDQPRTLGFAKKLFTQAVDCTKRVLGAVAEGKDLDMGDARLLVGRLVATVNANGSVLRLLSVLKEYDEYTYTHCVNVAAMGILFGKHLGLPDNQLEVLGMSGLMHDVGKCLLPSELVNKPGPLTGPEYEVMKRHTVLGWDYIKDQPGIPTPTAVGVLQHHERLDGTGYPGNIAGADIPGISRILSVLDVYDALTSDRVYRNRMSPHKALRTLYEKRGKAFSESVLDGFIKCVGVYPPSSVVQLKNGCYAVVTGYDERQPLQPDLVIFRGPEGMPVKPRRVELLRLEGIRGKSGYEIARHVEPSEMPPPPEHVWLKPC